ncbi:predicted protein [Sclerotinia sclerotiorum 1980 UF-70]|uniref:Uncharacterized protein n=1 Tax=Sclerotinia sclerotiorum (strain ATCC 18683 / 1980 / Ss-1) TaxID=665079 RepID=A7F513_SCLS1|nr:predicted protein [Sclerotinia sclerotiorum 1980 UF-70]EDN97834.1 predicted protein [Sclerotinia sclerotiorum 1980 UF-70]
MKIHDAYDVFETAGDGEPCNNLVGLLNNLSHLDLVRSLGQRWRNASFSPSFTMYLVEHYWADGTNAVSKCIFRMSSRYTFQIWNAKQSKMDISSSMKSRVIS